MRESLQINLSRRLTAVLAIVAVLGALLWFCWTLLLWFRWHPQLPWRDVFVILDQLLPLSEDGGHWRDWLFLLEPHYAAHRIALPRILVALDISFFQGRNHLLFASGWLGIFIILAVYARMARDFFQDAAVLWWFCCGVLGVLFFAPAHLWNLANAINTSWHVSLALAVLAFWVLLRKSGSPTTVDWLLAYGLATLSAFTTFAGVILWLLLPVMALFGSRRALLLTVACSALLTFSYMQGISSDAQIAVAWSTGDPAIVAQVVEAGKLAMEENTLVTIVKKTAMVLGWPLAADRPRLAGLFFALSLTPLGYGWFRFLRSSASGNDDIHPWLKLCLLMATLALGIALAIQLGRLIQQSNYAHGPSYERYNTVVAVYWAGLIGLLLGGLQRRSSHFRAAVMTAILVALWLLLAPGGTYLQQEISSLETAARLYAGGETPGLRDRVDRKLLRFKPEYVYRFDPLFEAGQLSYARPVEISDHSAYRPPCSPGTVRLNLVDSDKPGYRAVRGSLHGISHFLARDILLSEGGRLLGRLYPVHEGDYSPHDLIRPARTVWRGHVDSRGAPWEKLQVTLNLLGGIAMHCVLPGHMLEAGSASAQLTRGVPGDV